MGDGLHRPAEDERRRLQLAPTELGPTGREERGDQHLHLPLDVDLVCPRTGRRYEEIDGQLRERGG